VVSLTGASGKIKVKISGIALNPKTTYYLRANQAGTTKSTLKCFRKEGNTVNQLSFNGDGIEKIYVRKDEDLTQINNLVVGNSMIF